MGEAAQVQSQPVSSFDSEGFARMVGRAAELYRQKAETEAATPASLIYFVRAGDRGLIKIGRTDRLERRLSQLQNGNHLELRLLGYAHGDTAEEKSLHRRFAAGRIRGEWFRPTRELLRFIAKLRAEQRERGVHG